MAAAIQLVVGLGNPGPEYEKTRHNVGAWFVEALAERSATTLRVDKKFYGAVARYSEAGHEVALLNPTTFMNESGRSVAAFIKYYKISPQSILVAHDELDFPPGTVRLKKGGGHGGHNGLRDLVKALGTNDFYRLRIGIGHPGHRDKVSPYVLSEPSRSDRQKIDDSLIEAERVIDDLLGGDIDKAFRLLHSTLN